MAGYWPSSFLRVYGKERKGKELYLSSRSSAGALIGDIINRN